MRACLPHVHYCPLCDRTRRGECKCREPEATVHLCQTCLAYLFKDERRAA